MSFTKLPPFYAIDLGSNTCRLLIAEKEPNAQKDPLLDMRYPTFHTLDAFSRVVKLGESIDAHGNFSEAAMDRARDAVRECQKRINSYGIQSEFGCAVSTAAARQAKNARSFLNHVEKEFGIPFSVISEDQEARLAVLGCINMMSHERPYAVVFDIGGGSTEIALIKLNIEAKEGVDFLDTLSIPMGILNLNENTCSVQQQKSQARYISFFVNEFFSKNNIENLIREEQLQMIGTSGTVTMLASICLGNEKYDRSAVHGKVLEKKHILHTLQSIWSMSKQDRAYHRCIGPYRNDLISAGLIIFENIYDIISTDTILVADRGVREGVVVSLIQNYLSKLSAFKNS